MESNFGEMRILLNKISLINFKYTEILNSKQFDFNIFSILRNDHDEEHLHSRFIYELLNPNGSHQKGTIFLRLFLRILDIPEFEISEENTINVYKEYQGIDILIKSQKQAIIIENKIYAADQDKQLERYYTTIKNEGLDCIKIIYLTLYGDEPGEESIGELKECEDDLIKLVSYEKDIDTWMEECIKESALFPILRETLLQYQILIQNLTGKHHSKEYIMEIKELLIDEKNIQLATDISKALIEAKIEIQYDFWRIIVRELKKLDYAICWEPTRQNVEDYYNRSKNNKYYGIGFVLLDDIDEGENLSFYLEIDWHIYYGLYVDNGDEESEKNYHLNTKYDDLADMLIGIDSSFTRNEWWIGWKYPNRRYDFRSFNDENIFALADKTKRDAYVKELAIEIHVIIQNFMEKYKNRKTETNI